MTTHGPDNDPLWLAIEKKIQEMGAGEISDGNLEAPIQKLAGALDATGLTVSKNAGSMLALRDAVAARAGVGRDLMSDLDEGFKALTLDDVSSTYSATVNLIERIGKDWPALLGSERRPDILRIVESVRLDLVTGKAKELGGDAGIRFLIAEALAPEAIVDRLGITQEEHDRVVAEVAAERAERQRVAELIEGAEGKAEPDMIRHLITSDVAEDLIIEMAGVDQAAIDGVKRAMEEEIAEKQRLAEEAAAKKAAEAAGPSLDDIPDDEMLEHIEAIREIMEFSDKEDEIRKMCEQSSVPKDLIEIAISDSDRLDELEAAAEG